MAEEALTAEKEALDSYFQGDDADIRVRRCARRMCMHEMCGAGQRKSTYFHGLMKATVKGIRCVSEGVLYMMKAAHLHLLSRPGWLHAHKVLT